MVRPYWKKKTVALPRAPTEPVRCADENATFVALPVVTSGLAAWAAAGRMSAVATAIVPASAVR